MADMKTPVAFIGLGIMGAHMAAHILNAGHPLHVHNRTRAKAEPLIFRGAVWHDHPGDAAAVAGVVISIVGSPRDVEQIYFDDGGIIARAEPGTTLIDMTTSTPSLAVRIATEAEANGLYAIDAPVSGGAAGARDAKLSIMAGGSESAFEAVMPILQLMGSNIRHQGGPGAGQRTKLANQIVIAGTMLGVAEGLAYAQRAGLDLQKVLASIGTGAAGGFLLNNLGPKMINRDFTPGFFVEHFLKDMKIADEEATALGLNLKGLQTAARQYADLAAHGGLSDGHQALLKVYETKQGSGG